MNKASITKKPNKLSAFFVCLIIAGLIWLIHTLNTVYTREIILPVSFLNLPDTSGSGNNLPKELKIHLKGTGLKLLITKFHLSGSPLEIDLKKLNPLNEDKSAYILTNSSDYLLQSFALNVELKQVVPDTIQFFKRGVESEKFIPVKLNMHISPASGCSIQSLKIMPENVKVIGPFHELSTIDSVGTEYAKLENLDENATFALKLKSPSRELRFDKNEVEVYVTVGKGSLRSVKLPIISGKDSDGKKCHFYPSVVSVEYMCSKEIDPAEISKKIEVKADRTDPSNKDKLIVTVQSLSEEIIIKDYFPKAVDYIKE